MRTAWKGTFQLNALIGVPIRMGTALDARGSLFHQAHRPCGGGPIRQERRCEKCGAKDVPYDQIGKGIDMPDGSRMLFGDDEIDALKAWENKTLTLIHFCPAAQVDVRLYDQTYYVEPVDAGGPAHALLLAAIPDGLVAVCTMGFKDKAVPAVMRVAGGHFEVVTLRHPEELRPADVKLPPVPAPRAKEVQMAERLIKSMTRDFDPAEHANTYKQQLVELVAARSEGVLPGVPAAAKSTAGQYGDMMALLQASIAETKAKPRARRAPAAQAS
jgi:DNA end-binding protein Ku